MLCLFLSACASPPMNRALGPAAAALAAPELADGTLVPADKVAPLLAWVSRHTGVTITAAPAVLASTKALTQTGNRVQLAEAGETLKALYIPGVIVLDSDSFTTADPVELSYLVHELVHHAQFLSGAQVACAAEREAQAYRLQDQWLVEQGLQPLHTGAWIDGKARCRG
jgi:hypothetical protein